MKIASRSDFNSSIDLLSKSMLKIHILYLCPVMRVKNSSTRIWNWYYWTRVRGEFIGLESICVVNVGILLTGFFCFSSTSFVRNMDCLLRYIYICDLSGNWYKYLGKYLSEKCWEQITGYIYLTLQWTWKDLRRVYYF